MQKNKKKYKTGHELLKARREELNLSLRQLSAMTGIAATHIMHIEKGVKVPSMERGLLILEALRIPMKNYMEAIGYKDAIGGKKGGVVAVQGLEPRTF